MSVPPLPTAEILVQHSAWIRTLARQLVSDADLAEDLAQETMVVALQHPPTDTSRIRGWFSTVLRNLSREHHREQRARHDRERATAPAAHLPATDELVEKVQSHSRVANLLLELDEPYRTTVLLRFYEDLPPRLIAERQGLPVATVKSRLNRGLAKLRRELDVEYGNNRGAWVVALAPWAGELPTINAVSTGGIVMSAKSLGVAAGFVVLVAGWWSWSANHLQVPDHSVASLTDTAELAFEEATGLLFETDVAEDQNSSQRRVLSSGESETATLDPALIDCFVFGRIIDEGGHGLEGVDVQLMTYGDWTEGLDVPPLDADGKRRVVAQATGPDGGFRFEFPTPTAETVWMIITPHDYLDSERITFGGTWRPGRPPLLAGDNDCGAIRLAVTGAIAGIVSDELGNPLEGAEVGIGISVSTTTLSRDGYSNASGEYVIGHVRPGDWGLRVSLEGYVSQFRSPHLVERERTTTDRVDFVLVEAPRISGHVLDASGIPLAKASLQARTGTIGGGGNARSDSEGRFTIFLQANEPARISVRLEGYEPHGRESSLDDTEDQVRYSPGKADIEIVMERATRSRFRVVEETSGRPIELFELLVERDTGGEAPHRGYSRHSNRKPRPKHHENGEVELAARPGLDRFLLTAPGHARVAGEIEETEVQVIRLLRGARLTGRVLRDGAAVEGAHVALEEGRMVPAKEGTWPPQELVFRFRNVGKYEAWTDADGRFEIVGYSDGIHGLTVRDEQGAPLALAPLRLNEEKDRDVGDLEFPVGASIMGSVTVAAGLRVGGIEVNLDDWKDDVDCITDDKGQFRFDDLAPGRHTIDVPGVSGLLADGPNLVLDLVDGETRELTIDLTRRALGRVQVLVTENGEPREGWQVLFIPVADIGDLSIDYQYNRRFGQDLETDSEGYARGWAPTGESHYIEIHRPGAANFTHPTATITPRIDSAAEVECDFSFGSVKIVLPDDFAPEGNEFSLSLVSVNGEGGRILLHGFIKPEGLRVLRTYIKGPFQLDSIPVGEYRIYMDTYDLFASARKKLQDTGVPEDQRESFSTAEPIRIRAGVVTEIRLRR